MGDKANVGKDYSDKVNAGKDYAAFNETSSAEADSKKNATGSNQTSSSSSAESESEDNRAISSCACAKIYAPVCGEDKNNYGNPCLAECAGTNAACIGKCPCPASRSRYL